MKFPVVFQIDFFYRVPPPPHVIVSNLLSVLHHPSKTFCISKKKKKKKKKKKSEKGQTFGNILLSITQCIQIILPFLKNQQALLVACLKSCLYLNETTWSINSVLSGLTMFCIDIDPENASVCAIAYIIINFSEVIGCFYIQTSDPPPPPSKALSSLLEIC